MSKSEIIEAIKEIKRLDEGVQFLKIQGNIVYVIREKVTIISSESRTDPSPKETTKREEDQ